MLLSAVSAAICPLNPTNIVEAEHILRSTGPGVLVVKDKKSVADIQTVLSAQVAAYPLRIVCGTKSDLSLGDWISLEWILSVEKAAHKSSFKHSSSPSPPPYSFILFTSGTTSLPKAYPITDVNHCQIGRAHV